MTQTVLIVHKDGTEEYVEREVEYIPEEPIPTEELSVWDELDAAYREGVNSI